MHEPCPASSMTFTIWGRLIINSSRSWAAVLPYLSRDPLSGPHRRRTADRALHGGGAAGRVPAGAATVIDAARAIAAVPSPKSFMYHHPTIQFPGCHPAGRARLSRMRPHTSGQIGSCCRRQSLDSSDGHSATSRCLGRRREQTCNYGRSGFVSTNRSTSTTS